MNLPNAILLVTLVLSGTALAHSGVKNAAVSARMNAMSDIGAEMKILGQMAKGEVTFDAKAARAAAAAIAKLASRTPILFEAKEDDPKSEARGEIWNNFEDFVKKSRDLEFIAMELSTSISTESNMGAAMKSLGSSCQACHKVYRK